MIKMLIIELILVVVVAVVWLVGPLVGIKSVLWRLVIIFAIVIPPLLYLLYNFLKARKASSGLEKAIKDQGKAQQDSARPDRKGEIQELNDNFSEAILALKRSKLSGGRGTALYALPWYMIIGPPAVGKSTVLLRSGLKFPFTSNKRGSIKGVGGTRNCDWWFSDQAILLDTAGRYTSEDDDQEEWTAFLRMLKKYRRKRPLNGLMVAVSVADLITAKPDERKELADKIRSRIDQVIKELDLALPVYIMITKADLLGSFVQFFGDLKKSTRSQVFGFTVPLTDANTDIERLFNQEFELLVSRVRKRALNRLSTAKTNIRPEVFKFPIQFASIRDTLAEFVSQLMIANPYLEMPRLRGVYFCSGTQEGRPVDTVMGMMSNALGLREMDAASLDQKTTRKSYFLRDVFTKVIFPDQEIAGTSSMGLRSQNRFGMIALFISFLVSVGAVGAYSVTYSNNSTFIDSTLTVAKNSRITTPEDPRHVLDSLKALDVLRERMNTLKHHHEEGAPWSMGLGFYKGNKMLEDVEKIYLKRMRRAFVMPAGTELEATLQDIAQTTDPKPSSENVEGSRDFDLLKTYLMVTTTKYLNPKFATNVLLGQWRKRLHPEVAEERDLLFRNAERYLELLKAGRTTWLDKDNELIRNVRRELIRRNAMYQHLIRNTDKECRPVTIRDAMGGRVQDVLSTLYSVPSPYNRQCWEKLIRSRIAKQMVKKATEVETWVLYGDSGTSGKTTAHLLRDQYFANYIISWRRFLKGLGVKQPTTAQEAVEILEKISDQPSVYQSLFDTFVYNTELPPLPTSKALSKALKRTRLGGRMRQAQRLGLGDAAKSAIKKKANNKVEKAFWPIRELVIPPPGSDGRPQISGLSQYLSQIAALRDALSKDIKGTPAPPGGGLDKAIEEAKRTTKGILATLPGEHRRLISPLLEAPIEGAALEGRKASSKRASSSFVNEVCTPFLDTLSGKFPFARSKIDSNLQDAVNFFAPRGTAWKYYEKNLQASLVRKGDTFSPAQDKEIDPSIVGFFNNAWRISKALFPMGSQKPEIKVIVYPQPALTGNYQISEITLEVEGSAKTYRNGPIETWNFTWGGNGKRSRLLVRGAGGLREEISYEGEWGLMHLVKRAKKVIRRGSMHTVIWEFKKGKIKIPMRFRPLRTENPLFSNMHLECR